MRADCNGFHRLLALLLTAIVLLASPGAAAEEEAEQEGTDEGGADEGGADEGERKEGAPDASPFDAILRSNTPGAEPPAAEEAPPETAGEGARVEVPLAEFALLARRIDEARRARARDVGPKVVFGGASYEGEVAHGVLALRLSLHVTLAGDGAKVVPLVGDDVALVSATEGGEPIGVTRRPGYHVWVTDRRGAVTLELSLLVAPRGPRGSIEYAFRSARTPSTSLSVRLEAAGLAPRFDRAVRTEIRADKGGTTARATLEPTTEIRMVGFRDLGVEERRNAKLYAETSTLLSVDERAIELFTVARYNILYGAAQTFEIFVPAELEVVSADGEGAFRHVIEPRDGGSVLRGETAFPVQGNYEISLRLRRKGGDAPLGAPPLADEAFDVVLPRCLGVEREHGWLAVEVPGKLLLDEKSRRDLAGVDVRQLPSEVAGSAVSPILKAYRYHRASPGLRLAVERLPEKELDDGAIDRIDAVSVLSPEGKLLTELRIALRNALRPSLALTLPDATEVRSALLDGEPVRPSRDESGRLLLPLKRSRGEDRQEPVALVVVLESQRPPLGLAGAPEIALPAADLTIASLHWQLHLPAHDHWGDIRARMAPQPYAGAASWHKPPHMTRAVRWDDDGAQGDAASSPGGSARLELPRTGVELAYQRHWVAAGEAVRIQLPHVRAWLLLPLKLLLAALLALAVGMAPLAAPSPRTRALRAARLLACAGLGLLLWRLGGHLHAGGAVLAGIAVLVDKRVPRAQIAARLRALPARTAAWWRRQVWTRRRAAGALALALGAAAAYGLLLDRVWRLVKTIAGGAGMY